MALQSHLEAGFRARIAAVEVGPGSVSVTVQAAARRGYIGVNLDGPSYGYPPERPDVILWPETATPFYFEDDPDGRHQIELLVRAVRIPLVFGSPAVERGAADAGTYFNRAYLLGAGGDIAATYDKRVLVPFGENVPYGSVLSFIRPLVTSPLPMTPGSTSGVFRVAGAHLGVLLCYENAFPSLARAAVREDATVLVNLSNDAWFGGDAGSAQALALAQLRAIEQRRPLVRVASGGYSAVIDATGRVVWRAHPTDAAAHVANVEWVEGRTLYSHVGDVVVWASIALALWSMRVIATAATAAPGQSDGSRDHG